MRCLQYVLCQIGGRLALHGVLHLSGIEGMAYILFSSHHAAMPSAV